MARFYFHIRDGELSYRDSAGVELADIRYAWLHALEDARLFAAKRIFDGPHRELWIEIGDDKTSIFGAVPLTHALSRH